MRRQLAGAQDDAQAMRDKIDDILADCQAQLDAKSREYKDIVAQWQMQLDAKAREFDEMQKEVRCMDETSSSLQPMDCCLS